MHRQKLLTRTSSCDDDKDKNKNNCGGHCSRWSTDAASSSDSDSNFASPLINRWRKRRRRRTCKSWLGAFFGHGGDGVGCRGGRATVFGCSKSGFLTAAAAAAAAGTILLVLLTVVLMVSNASSRGDRGTLSLAEIKEKYLNKKMMMTRRLSPPTAATTTAAATAMKLLSPPPLLATPVLIALVNEFYFGERYARFVPECRTWEGAILPCEFTTDQARFNSSDALAFHIPSMFKDGALDEIDQAREQRWDHQALLGISVESSANYPLLADEQFLARFDLLATLVPPPLEEKKEGLDNKGVEKEHASVSKVSKKGRRPKRIWYPYYDDMFRRCWEAEGNPTADVTAKAKSSLSSSGLSFSFFPSSLFLSSSPSSSRGKKAENASTPPHLLLRRENAVAYVNSNCDTMSDRDAIVFQIAQALEPLGVPLRAPGKCLNNMPRVARSSSKIDALRPFKFCIAMENSEDDHYVSEKVYDALVAGCVPIYFGAPNIVDYVPHRDAIIDVRALGGAKKAAEEIARLAFDDVAYASKHAWRDLPSTWSDGFKRLQAQTWRDGVGPFTKCDLPAGLSDPHMRRQCVICREVAAWRGDERRLIH